MGKITPIGLLVATLLMPLTVLAETPTAEDWIHWHTGCSQEVNEEYDLCVYLMAPESGLNVSQEQLQHNPFKTLNIKEDVQVVEGEMQ